MTLKAQIQQIDKHLKQWQELQPLKKEDEDRLWQKLRLEWNFNSNHIEGNTLTYLETKQLLLKEIVSGDHSKRELDEMQAHDAAVQMVTQWAEDPDRDITEADIRELNRIILVKPYWKNAITEDGQDTKREIRIGEYKKYPNSVRLQSGEIFHYTSPEETPQEMEKLMKWYRNAGDEHPVILAAEMHYRFVRIHPFDDGNGRIARLLTNYILMRHGYLPIVIKSKEKNQYLTALQKADTGEITAFHEFIAKQVVWSLELGIKAAKGESVEEPEDLDKKIDVFGRKVLTKDVEVAKSHKVVEACIKTVYIEHLKVLYEKTLKIKKLFKDLKCLYYKESHNKTPFVPVGVDFNKLLVIFEKRAEHKSIPKHQYATLFWLEGFRDLKKPFKMEIATSIIFNDYSYEITYYVGEPYGSILDPETLVEVYEKSKTEGKLPLTHRYKDVVEVPYSETINHEKLNEFSNTIANKALKWIEKKYETICRSNE